MSDTPELTHEETEVREWVKNLFAPTKDDRGFRDPTTDEGKSA